MLNLNEMHEVYKQNGIAGLEKRGVLNTTIATYLIEIGIPQNEVKMTLTKTWGKQKVSAVADELKEIIDSMITDGTVEPSGNLFFHRRQAYCALTK